MNSGHQCEGECTVIETWNWRGITVESRKQEEESQLKVKHKTRTHY